MKTSNDRKLPSFSPSLRAVSALSDAQVQDEFDDLVMRASEGDSRAIAAIAVALGPMLRTEARSVLRELAQDADDVLQASPRRGERGSGAATGDGGCGLPVPLPVSSHPRSAAREERVCPANGAQSPLRWRRSARNGRADTRHGRAPAKLAGEALAWLKRRRIPFRSALWPYPP
jgi:hypothetical protein